VTPSVEECDVGQVGARRHGRDRDGRTVYGTVEGVAWTGPAEVVVVSDRADRDHPRWREKDQSIHVFAVPSPEGAGD